MEAQIESAGPDGGRTSMTKKFLDEGYECVEIELGRELPLLADPDLDPTHRQRLLAHVGVCDDCRLRLDLEVRVAARIRDGKSDFRPATAGVGQNRRAHLMVWVGGASLAAGLGLLMVLPPQARDAEFRYRSQEQGTIIRPVEGEVVATGEPTFKWNSVEGANSYRLVVNEVGGEGSWEGETSETRWSVPADKNLPRGKVFRAILNTVPADLTPPAGFTVSFRTGSWSELLGQRLRRGNNAARMVGLLGAVFSVLAWGRFARTR